MGQPEQLSAMPPGNWSSRQSLRGAELRLELRRCLRCRPGLDELPGPPPKPALALDQPVRYRVWSRAILDAQCPVDHVVLSPSSIGGDRSTHVGHGGSSLGHIGREIGGDHRVEPMQIQGEDERPRLPSPSLARMWRRPKSGQDGHEYAGRGQEMNRGSTSSIQSVAVPDDGTYGTRWPFILPVESLAFVKNL